MTDLNEHLKKFENGKDNIFSLNISFPHVRKSYGICEGRIIFAVLRALRNTIQFTKILPWKENSTAKAITNEDEIEYNETFTREYLKDPKHTANDKYVTRMRIESKKPCFWILRDPMLKKWLKEEKFNFEENNLADIHIPTMGFLTDSFPRDSLDKIFEERIKKLIPNAPPFLCHTDYLGSGDHYCKVIMIKTEQKNERQLIKLLSGTSMRETFITWTSYMKFAEGRKVNLIKKQNQLHYNSKSLVIMGFKDDGTIKMG
jgi:hypothetical protein